MVTAPVFAMLAMTAATTTTSLKVLARVPPSPVPPPGHSIDSNHKSAMPPRDKKVHCADFPLRGIDAGPWNCIVPRRGWSEGRGWFGGGGVLLGGTLLFVVEAVRELVLLLCLRCLSSMLLLRCFDWNGGAVMVVPMCL